MKQDTLELRYVPLAQAQLWDANPKRHDLDALIRSIEQHGFGDPPKFDSKLDGLVYGNGRTEALQTMRAIGQNPPEAWPFRRMANGRCRSCLASMRRADHRPWPSL